MKPITPQWPRLIADGGWREVRIASYWPIYIKTHHGQRYTIGHNSELLCWELRVMGIRVARGALSDLLHRAAVLMDGDTGNQRSVASWNR